MPALRGPSRLPCRNMTPGGKAANGIRRGRGESHASQEMIDSLVAMRLLADGELRVFIGAGTPRTVGLRNATSAESFR